MEAVYAIPEELWRHIFAYLPDYHLARSIIPVCKLFKDLAFSVGFRQCGADNGVNLGHDWLLFHELHQDFLRRIPAPKRLEFKSSKESLDYLREPDMKFEMGLERIDKIKNEDFPGFNAAQSTLEREKMVETVRFCPELESLKIDHKSYERFGAFSQTTTRRAAASIASFSPRISPQTPVSTDCPSANAVFLKQMLQPVQSSIKDIDLNLACVCPRVSERRRGPDVSGEFQSRVTRIDRVTGSQWFYHGQTKEGQTEKCSLHTVRISLPDNGGHVSTSLPLFGTLQATPISACAGLTSLALSNGINGRAFELFATTLTNLRSLTLVECGNLNGSDLKVISNHISEGAFSKIDAWHLKALSGFCVKASDLNDFFTSVPEWTGKLASLGIDFSVYQEEHDDGSGFDLNPVFRLCVRLRQLNLHAHFTSAPDFEVAANLKNLRLLSFGWIADRADLRAGSPSLEPRPTPAPWNKIVPVTSLTIRVHDLPPLGTSIVSWQRCFGQLVSLRLLDTDRSYAFPFLEQILSVCGSSLKSFGIGALQGAEPLAISNETDFQLTSLDLGEGGEILWRNLPSANFQFLTHFEYNTVEFHLASFKDDPELVTFILRVCEASAPSLRRLELETNLPVEHLPMLARLSKLEVLKIHFYEDKLKVRKSAMEFVWACNRIFPVVCVDEENDVYLDELASFPAMREFEVTQLRGYSCDEFSHPDTYTYSLKKTCFGQIKRSLLFSPPPTSHVTIYMSLSAHDVADGNIPLEGL